MDLDGIIDQLWNSYYAATDQFVFDIQCVVHNSEGWPDRDRANRAQKMFDETKRYLSQELENKFLLECHRLKEESESRKVVARTCKSVENNGRKSSTSIL
jgi:hypothetical protein